MAILIKIEVAGMPLHWKVFNFFLIFLPKALIMILIIDQVNNDSSTIKLIIIMIMIIHIVYSIIPDLPAQGPESKQIDRHVDD